MLIALILYVKYNPIRVCEGEKSDSESCMHGEMFQIYRGIVSLIILYMIFIAENDLYNLTMYFILRL